MGMMGRSPVKEKEQEVEKQGDSLAHHTGLTQGEGEKKRLRLQCRVQQRFSRANEGSSSQSHPVLESHVKNELVLMHDHWLGADGEKRGRGKNMAVDSENSRCSPSGRSEWCIFTAPPSFMGTFHFITSQY